MPTKARIMKLLSLFSLEELSTIDLGTLIIFEGGVSSISEGV